MEHYLKQNVWPDYRFFSFSHEKSKQPQDKSFRL